MKKLSVICISIIFVLSAIWGKIQDQDVFQGQQAGIKTEPTGIIAIKTEFGMDEPFDLSPDGKKMVGVQISGKGQNIVVSDLETGQRYYITNFEYADEYYETYNPSWSPDGKDIAYLSSYSGKKGTIDNQLCVSNLEGKTRTLLRSETDWYTPYAWMPDGRSILTIKVDKDNKQELGLVSSRGGEFKKIIDLMGRVERYGKTRPTASISPDGRFIAYTDIQPSEESELFITTAEGKAPWPLAPSPAIDRMPRWSPDGKHIIFLSNRNGGWALWGVSIEEGRPGAPFLIQEGMGDNTFGNWTVHGLVAWNWTRMRDIFLLDVDPATGEPAGNAQKLDYFPAGSNSHPTFSPDGSRLAFIRRDTMATKTYLVVYQGNKGNVREYEFPERRVPRSLKWMHDSSGIAIICGNIILTLSFDSGTWKTYPPPGRPGARSTVALSKDGKSILYGKNGLFEEGAGILERKLETGEEQYVFRPKEGASLNIRSLKCSRDFKKIAFLDSDANLTVVDLSTGKSQILKSKSPGRLVWSPEGWRIMSIGSVDREKKGTFLIVSSIADGSVKEYDLVDIIKNMPQGDVIQLDWSTDGKQMAFQLLHIKSEHLIYANIIPEHEI